LNNNKIIQPEDLVALGIILKPYSLSGELKVFLYNNESITLKSKINVWLKVKNKFNYFNIDYIKNHNRYKIIKFNDIDNRSKAQLLVNTTIYLSRKKFPLLEDNSNFYLSDIIGFKVKDYKGKIYGKVIDVIAFPTNNSILIFYDNKEILIPLIDDFLQLFDFDNKMIIIKNIKNLLE